MFGALQVAEASRGVDRHVALRLGRAQLVDAQARADGQQPARGEGSRRHGAEDDEVVERLHARLFLGTVAFEHEGGRTEETEVPADTEHDEGDPEMHHIDPRQPDGCGDARQRQARHDHARCTEACDQAPGEEAGRAHGLEPDTGCRVVGGGAEQFQCLRHPLAPVTEHPHRLGSGPRLRGLEHLAEQTFVHPVERLADPQCLHQGVLIGGLFGIEPFDPFLQRSDHRLRVAGAEFDSGPGAHVVFRFFQEVEQFRDGCAGDLRRILQRPGRAGDAVDAAVQLVAVRRLVRGAAAAREAARERVQRTQSRIWVVNRRYQVYGGAAGGRGGGPHRPRVCRAAVLLPPGEDRRLRPCRSGSLSGCHSEGDRSSRRPIRSGCGLTSPPSSVRGERASGRA